MHKRIKKLIFIYLSLLSQCLWADSLKSDLRISTLKNQHKLSNPSIKGFIEDRYGFTWIATNDGLNRFDGIENKVYSLSINNEIPANLEIKSLILDESSNLIVGTSKGIFILQEEKDSFRHLVFDKTIGLNKINVETMYVSTSGNLFVSSYGGELYRISRNKNSAEKVNISRTERGGKLYFRNFFEMDDELYVASNKSLFKFNESFTVVFPFKNLEYKNELNILSIYKLSKTKVAIGTTHGLYFADYQSNLVEEVRPDILSKSIITDLISKNNSLFVGTSRKGLFTVDLETFETRNYTKSASQNSISNNQISSFFVNKNNILFIATNYGVNTINLEQQKLGHYGFKANGCLPSNTIYAILKQSKGSIWVAPFGHGLYTLDLDRSICSKLQLTNHNEKIKNVVDLHETESGDIWIGTYRSGIYRYMPNNQSIVSFEEIVSNEFDNSKILKPNYISSVNSDESKNIYIATLDNGFYILNNENKKIYNYLINDEIRSVKEVIKFNGYYWIATSKNGLWKFNFRENVFKKITNNIPDQLISITHNGNQSIWIGTKNEGAIEYNVKDETSIFHNTNTGLNNNVVMNVIIDQYNFVWFFTDDGLTRYNPKNSTYYTLTKEDGLQDNAFTPTGSLTFDNEILTGGVNGFNKFKPEIILTSTVQSPTLITGMELFYKRVNVDEDSVRFTLQNPVHLSKVLKLNYDQNVFGFSFTSFNYLAPNKSKFKFKLEGYDESWISLDSSRNYANYTNISPGEYTFRVKSQNKDLSWSNLDDNLKIVITPPWWQTISAYIAYVITAILSLYFFINYRTKALQQKARELESSVKERTLELSQEKQKVEQLLSRKNEEFANVSHEFRTPLTLILGPVSQMLRAKQDVSNTSRLTIVQRNGYRLLRMVDQLLNMETFRVKAITQKSPQAIGQTVQLLSEAFADLAEEKSIQLSIKELTDVSFEFTPDAFEKILLNLLSNAIKYSKPGDKIAVSSTRTSNNEFRLTVSDTGIGIPEDKLNTVFERFNRVLDENSERVTGAGIGLALVKELVEAHQGKIEIKSQLGEGTTIAVTLPIIGEVSSESVSEHVNDEIVAMELMSLSEKAEDQQEKQEELESTQSSNLPTLLVIEDNSDMREYIVECVKSDYRIITAKNGREGFELAVKEVPDLIISDIMMPEMDGYETTAALRKDEVTNHIPVILLTARGDRESRLKGWHEQADEYLTKPFDTEELQIRLRNLLSIRNILKKRFSESAFEKTSTVPKTEEQDIENAKNEVLQAFVDKLNATLEKVYSNADVSVTDITKLLAMSQRQFFRKMKSVLDMTPSEYLRRFRLEKAKLLLAEGKSANAASFEVGFSSHSYFGKCFKAQFGLSPTEFKKTIKN